MLVCVCVCEYPYRHAHYIERNKHESMDVTHTNTHTHTHTYIYTSLFFTQTDMYIFTLILAYIIEHEYVLSRTRMYALYLCVYLCIYKCIRTYLNNLNEYIWIGINGRACVCARLHMYI